MNWVEEVIYWSVSYSYFFSFRVSWNIFNAPVQVSRMDFSKEQVNKFLVSSLVGIITMKDSMFPDHISY